jgi:hypothetical protein
MKNPSRGPDSVLLGLEVLSAVRGPGERFTLEDIADVCECSKQYVASVESAALRKIRRELREAGVTENDILETLSVRDRTPNDPYFIRHLKSVASTK